MRALRDIGIIGAGPYGLSCAAYLNHRQVDHHVIAATGFKTDIARLDFLDRSLVRDIATFGGAPLLSRDFESSVANLYIVGPSAALSFGPLMRFAVGADYTSRRLTRHLSRTHRRSTFPQSEAALSEPLAAAE